MTITTEKLRQVLKDHGPLVDQALEQFFPDPEAPMNLAALGALTDDGQDVADVLAEVLTQGELSKSLEAFLNARGIDVMPREPGETWVEKNTAFPGSAIAEPDPNDFPLERLGRFALRASAFRCRVEVDGEEAGSGAFISKTLVLTAAHVVEKAIAAHQGAENGTGAGPVPAIMIRASDGQRYSARPVWSSPVHDDERSGLLPPAHATDTHKDVALLRVNLPLGLSYGYCDLPGEAIDWTGARLMTLVHYPEGNRRGLTRGRVHRDSPQDIRLRHDVDTMGGSSGGLAFDRNLQFIGVHQGRWDAFRRLVPHGQFGDHPDFVSAISRDQPRRYLWSLNDDIDSPLIIGRRTFFTGLSHMLEEPGSNLRGIWVRRVNTSSMTGLSFSFGMLEAFLQNRTHPGDPVTRNLCRRIPTGLEDTDLTGTLADAFPGMAAVAAHAGVGPDETSDAAAERERAVRVAQALQQAAAAQDATFWIFFEPPPDNKLSAAALTQFEHLAEWIVTHRNLRLILAGFEQYALAPLQFQNTGEADTARRPGLLVDQLNNFDDEDVRVTLRAMLEDLNGDENISTDLLDRFVRQVTKDLDKEENSDRYRFGALPEAVKRTREIIRGWVGL
ncbi:trypsin-like serine peptidase [Roseobacter ponti]|uniref:Serine protease n=1 Tax=Roseobacter ponti TaxID=1891787 RepID=A0A858SRR4_9RHOB|nr:serine protease [Roseobacter ponti]QJF51030.1 trypsin-like peptidase domain-containing protein [Roseobacter ponti]